MLSNGDGRYFLRCRDCLRTSPTWPANDTWRVLAAAKAGGWLVETATHGRGYVVTCPACVRRADKVGVGARR